MKWHRDKTVSAPSRGQGGHKICFHRPSSDGFSEQRQRSCHSRSTFMTEQGRARIHAERPRNTGRHRQRRGRLKRRQHQMDNHCYRPSGKRLHRCVLAVPQAALMRTTTSFYIDGVYSCLNSVPWFSNRTMLLSFSFFPHVRKKEKETSRPSCIDWHVLLFVGQTTAMDALWASRTDARPDSCTAVPSLYLSA